MTPVPVPVVNEVADAIAQALVDTRDENVAMWKDSEILKDVVAYLTEAVCESPQVRAAFDAQAKLDAGAGRVENALRAERDALAARLADVEAEAYYWRSLCSEDDRVEQLQRRLAEVEAERDEAVKLAYERIEKQNVETGKRVDLIHEREAFRAERDRLAQELEDALGHLRGLCTIEGGYDKVIDHPVLVERLGEANRFLARFPVKEGDET